MPKYKVLSQIRGLDEPKKVKGALIEDVAEPGDIREMDADIAEPLLKGKAIELVGATDDEPAAASGAH